MVENATLIDVCALADLSAEQARLVSVAGRQVGLVLYQGRPVAIVNACPHYGGPLAQGPISLARGEIICPWHRFRFDLATGRSVTNPAMVAPFLPTVVRDGRVFVDVSPLTSQEV
jgi:nitrite reductase/ring-hydroxylating ferredoxin subunit